MLHLSSSLMLTMTDCMCKELYLSYTFIFFSKVPTAPPQAVEVRPENPTTLALSWQPPSLENQNGIIIHYRVNITEIETGRLLSFSAVNTSVRVSPLHPFYTYTCIVAAVTVGLGPYSAPFVVRTPEDGNQILLIIYTSRHCNLFFLVQHHPVHQ